MSTKNNLFKSGPPASDSGILGFLGPGGGGGGLGPFDPFLVGGSQDCDFFNDGLGFAVTMQGCGGSGSGCMINGQAGICATTAAPFAGGSSGNSSPSPTWAGIHTFFFTNPLPSAWNSVGSENGCDHLLLETFLKDVVPVPVPIEGSPGPNETVDVLTKGASVFAYSVAMSHAASATNVLGMKGLLYPFKSSTFRSLLGISKVAEDIALPAAIIGSTAHALGRAGWAAWNGECQ